MKANDILLQLEKLSINVITGVPDSTLKQFCDGLMLSGNRFRHYVTANEGAAVGLAVGSYLSSRRPACVYMQNSGIGNAVNPLASLANVDVYGIPMLFLIGWRGEPGVKDEPQHVFQGKITCGLLDTLAVPFSIIDRDTTAGQLEDIFGRVEEAFAELKQYALVIKKGTFEKEESFSWENGNEMVREQVLGKLLESLPKEACIVSTTGKISRELYEQSNRLYGNHDSLFMTVGGMGHASMIAFGIARNRPDKKVVCIDGDGAALMHMGALPFIASQAPENFYHIVINNQAHESVGAMPTGCRQADFAAIARAAGYAGSKKVENCQGIRALGEEIGVRKGPLFYEIPVSLGSRADLSRPAETARENKEAFMRRLEGREECMDAGS